MKVVKLEIDGRWKSADLNEVTLTLRDDGGNDVKMSLPFTPELLARVYNSVLPEITNQVSAMFEGLTGAAVPIDGEMPVAPKRDPFLETEEKNDES